MLTWTTKISSRLVGAPIQLLENVHSVTIDAIRWSVLTQPIRNVARSSVRILPQLTCWRISKKRELYVKEQMCNHAELIPKKSRGRMIFWQSYFSHVYSPGRSEWIGFFLRGEWRWWVFVRLTHKCWSGIRPGPSLVSGIVIRLTIMAFLVLYKNESKSCNVFNVSATTWLKDQVGHYCQLLVKSKEATGIK